MALSRHKLREIAMTSLYQHFLLGKDIKQCVFDNSETNEIDPFLYTVTLDAIKYEDTYIEKIDSNLRDDWTFERLVYVEKAILLMACCELDLETAPKAIVIDEAITLAKKFCDEETYRLINGVLDQL
ncbi:MAG: transcription antitermination factor NusB [Longicatena sp.]